MDASVLRTVFFVFAGVVVTSLGGSGPGSDGFTWFVAQIHDDFLEAR